MASDRLPPGPRSPAVAQTLRYLSDPLGLMRSCAERFGDVFTIELSGVGKLVLVTSPEHVARLSSELLHGETPADSSIERRHASGDVLRLRAERAVASWRAGTIFPALRAMHDITADHEVTAIALTWALEAILGRPHVLSRLRADIHALELDRAAAAPTPLELARLTYLDAVLRETLRLRPIMAVGNAGILERPFAIAGYRLPEGTHLASCVSELHRRPELYPDPDTFRPERFLERAPACHEFSPFGGGARERAAMTSALYELKVVLITLLSRARLELTCRDIRARARGFLLAPEAGLPLSFLGMQEGT